MLSFPHLVLVKAGNREGYQANGEIERENLKNRPTAKLQLHRTSVGHQSRWPNPHRFVDGVKF